MAPMACLLVPPRLDAVVVLAKIDDLVQMGRHVERCYSRGYVSDHVLTRKCLVRNLLSRTTCCSMGVWNADIASDRTWLAFEAVLSLLTADQDTALLLELFHRDRW